MLSGCRLERVQTLSLACILLLILWLHAVCCDSNATSSKDDVYTSETLQSEPVVSVLVKIEPNWAWPKNKTTVDTTAATVTTVLDGPLYDSVSQSRTLVDEDDARVSVGYDYMHELGEYFYRKSPDLYLRFLRYLSEAIDVLFSATSSTTHNQAEKENRVGLLLSDEVLMLQLIHGFINSTDTVEPDKAVPTRLTLVDTYMVDMAIGLRQYAPKMQAIYEQAGQTSRQLRARLSSSRTAAVVECYLVIDGAVYVDTVDCAVEGETRALALGEPILTGFAVDKASLIGYEFVATAEAGAEDEVAEDSIVQIALFGHLASPRFHLLHQYVLSMDSFRARQVAYSIYYVRGTGSRGSGRPWYLSGYGVELMYKNTEYMAVNTDDGDPIAPRDTSILPGQDAPSEGAADDWVADYAALETWLKAHNKKYDRVLPSVSRTTTQPRTESGLAKYAYEEIARKAIYYLHRLRLGQKQDTLTQSRTLLRVLKNMSNNLPLFAALLNTLHLTRAETQALDLHCHGDLMARSGATHAGPLSLKTVLLAKHGYCVDFNGGWLLNVHLQSIFKLWQWMTQYHNWADRATRLLVGNDGAVAATELAWIKRVLSPTNTVGRAGGEPRLVVFDVHGAAIVSGDASPIIYVNDIERDVRYQGWTLGLEDLFGHPILLADTTAARFSQWLFSPSERLAFRANMVKCVLVLHPFQPGHIQILKVLMEIFAGRLPMQIGILPINPYEGAASTGAEPGGHTPCETLRVAIKMLYWVAKRQGIPVAVLFLDKLSSLVDATGLPTMKTLELFGQSLGLSAATLDVWARDSATEDVVSRMYQRAHGLLWQGVFEQQLALPAVVMNGRLVALPGTGITSASLEDILGEFMAQMGHFKRLWQSGALEGNATTSQDWTKVYQQGQRVLSKRNAVIFAPEAIEEEGKGERKDTSATVKSRHDTLSTKDAYCERRVYLPQSIFMDPNMTTAMTAFPIAHMHGNTQGGSDGAAMVQVWLPLSVILENVPRSSPARQAAIIADHAVLVDSLVYVRSCLEYLGRWQQSRATGTVIVYLLLHASASNQSRESAERDGRGDDVAALASLIDTGYVLDHYQRLLLKLMALGGSIVSADTPAAVLEGLIREMDVYLSDAEKDETPLHTFTTTAIHKVFKGVIKGHVHIQRRLKAGKRPLALLSSFVVCNGRVVPSHALTPDELPLMLDLETSAAFGADKYQRIYDALVERRETQGGGGYDDNMNKAIYQKAFKWIQIALIQRSFVATVMAPNSPYKDTVSPDPAGTEWAEKQPTAADKTHVSPYTFPAPHACPSGALFDLDVWLDPLSPHTPKLAATLEYWLTAAGTSVSPSALVSLQVHYYIMSTKDRQTDTVVATDASRSSPDWTPDYYYRYVLPSPIAKEAGTVGAVFRGLPKEPLFTLSLHTPSAWFAMPKESSCPYDPDNLRLGDVRATRPTDGPPAHVVNIVYTLDYIVIEGQCFEIASSGASLSVPRGLPLLLIPHQGSLSVGPGAPPPVSYDTLVMANYGYFQLKAHLGLVDLCLPPGRASDMYSIQQIRAAADTPRRTAGATMAIDSYDGPCVVQLGVSVLPTWTGSAAFLDPAGVVDSQATQQATQAALPTLYSRLATLFGLGTPNTSPPVAVAPPETLYIFSVASGHLYERFLRIMIKSVMDHTHPPVHFYFMSQFLSPAFLATLPEYAALLGFTYSMIDYHWPLWLRPQIVKQRRIWAYKMLFLDVLFPLHVKRVIFVDADQMVRVDLRLLLTEDLQGAPYAFAPMGDSRRETEGYRFWKVGYWKTHLKGKPYHISALYLVDLDQFRRLAGGDIIRKQYQALSSDPDSLANLDQDLPNNIQAILRIHTLDRSWLWCETWCGDSEYASARTIDLCNNPLTKEPKLTRAKRILPEWEPTDRWIKGVLWGIHAWKAQRAARQTDLAWLPWWHAHQQDYVVQGSAESPPLEARPDL